MGFIFRIFHRVPVFCCIPEFGSKPGLAFFQFKSAPVESDGGTVEDIAVQGFILFIALIGSELIIVEDMGSENKIVLDLFHFDRCTGFETFDFE